MQMQNIVLKDNATPTPNNHTYVPISLVNNRGVYRELAGALINQSSIEVSTALATKTNSGSRAQWKLVLPHPLDPEDACCNVNTPTPESWVSIQSFSSKLATVDEILDLVARLQDLVKDPQFIATLKGEGLR